VAGAAPAIAFAEVSKRFRGGTLALDGATWSVAEGAPACLLGPNGAGKSTSIRLLQGALAPTAGRVSLLGAGVGGAGFGEARRRCGIVPQHPGMYRELTAGEYLTLAARLCGDGAAGRERVVDAFGLAPHLRTRMARLSGGFQRRLVLAAALVGEPQLLLLDEPTVGLDPLVAHDVHEYLRSFMRGRTTLLCAHNLAEAEALCEDVVILRQGRVIVQGAIDELRRGGRPQVRIVARQGAEAVRRSLAAAEMAVHGADEGSGGVLVEVDDVERDAPALLRRLLADGVDVYACVPVRTTLTDLFLEAVQ
jgi:ABC-2 type transport system ATP-binding protein